MGLVALDAEAVAGYNLLSPFTSDSVYLIDNCGRIVHGWSPVNALGSSAYLLENGDLLRQGSRRNTPFANSASCGVIERYDWEGNLLWEYDLTSTQTCVHHDLEWLPNGNVLVIAYGLKSEAEAIHAGRQLDRISVEGLWEDKILEIQQTGPTTGRIVWEWHIWDHLVQDYDSTKSGYGRVSDHPELLDINFPVSPYESNPAAPDWMHSNSIDYHPDLDQIMVSSRHTSEIWVIDHSTTTAEAASHSGGRSGKGGDLLYRWGNPQIYQRGAAADQQLHGQHDARWIKEGHPWSGKIMVFNNGDVNRPYSSVEVLQAPMDAQENYTLNADTTFGPDQPDWIYAGGADQGWYSPFISGAQPLANDHVLICDGPVGRVFEVDTLGNRYWEYINPVTSLGPQEQGRPIAQNYLFRMERYAVEYPGLAGRDLRPGARVERNPLALPVSCLETPPGIDTTIALTIYPNPFENSFQIITEAGEPMELQVFDLVGRTVLPRKNVANGEVLDTTGWREGVYMLQFTGTRTSILKVFKTRY